MAVVRGGLGETHPLASVWPPVSAASTKFHFSGWRGASSPLWRGREAMIPQAALRLATAGEGSLSATTPMAGRVNSPGRVQGPRGGLPSTEISKASELEVLRKGLENRDRGRLSFEKTPAGRGGPPARPVRRGAGGARGWAELRVRSGPAAGTRRCARCLNEPGLPARATSREPAAGAATAGFPQRAGRRRPSGTRRGGPRRCVRCKEAAAAGDGDRAKLPRRAVTAAPPPPQALSERRR